MRVNFFIIFLVLFASISVAQNNPKKGSEGKLDAPDMSVLSDSGKGKSKSKKDSDTMNIIPETSYGKVSLGANFGMTFFSGDVKADAIYPGFGFFAKYSFSHIMGIRLQYLQGQFSGGLDSKNGVTNSYFKTDVSNINLQLLFNLGGVDFRKVFQKIISILGLG